MFPNSSVSVNSRVLDGTAGEFCDLELKAHHITVTHLVNVGMSQRKMMDAYRVQRRWKRRKLRPEDGGGGGGGGGREYSIHMEVKDLGCAVTIAKALV